MGVLLLHLLIELHRFGKHPVVGGFENGRQPRRRQPVRGVIAPSVLLARADQMPRLGAYGRLFRMKEIGDAFYKLH